MIAAASPALPRLIIPDGKAEPLLPLVFVKPAIRYPVFSLLLIMDLYKLTALVLEPIMSVLKKTVPAFSCFFARVKKNSLMQKVKKVCINQSEINSL